MVRRECVRKVQRTLIDINRGYSRADKYSARGIRLWNQGKQFLNDGIAARIPLRALSIRQHARRERNALPLPQTFVAYEEEGLVLADRPSSISAELISFEGRLRIRRLHTGLRHGL